MSETPKVGDRVRVTDTWEGVVTDVAKNGTEFFIDGNISIRKNFGSPLRQVEILERAKPVWQDGDVARNVADYGLDPTGLRFLLGGNWHSPTGTRQMGGVEAADRLGYVLYMRDGKLVGDQAL